MQYRTITSVRRNYNAQSVGIPAATTAPSVPDGSAEAAPANLGRCHALVLGIDKFMSECRALTNFIGNGVATIVVSAWESELDRDKLARGLARRVDPSNVETAVTTG